MKMPKLHIQLPYIAFIILLSAVMCAHAHPDDKTKPIYLSSDSADLNQSTHRGEYIGHVDFRQGSSHITSARAVTLVDKDNKLTQADAYGDEKVRAHFSTLTDSNKPRLNAYAKIIRYFPKKHLIELEGHAEVTQGNDRFEADLIKYDTLNQHVISNSKGDHRTLIIINSDKVK